MEKGRLIIDGVDVSGSVGSAASVPYSNTNSGLEATNTQGAIDELATSVTELNSNLSNVSIPFIDTSRVLYTQNNKNFTYTATEDCAVVGTIETSGANSSTIYINDVRTGGAYCQSGSVTVSVFLPLKKGQILKVDAGAFNSSYPLKIFALL